MTKLHIIGLSAAVALLISADLSLMMARHNVEQATAAIDAFPLHDGNVVAARDNEMVELYAELAAVDKPVRTPLCSLEAYLRGDTMCDSVEPVTFTP